MTRYQDLWRDGTLVARGRRDCAARYQLIRPALEGRLGRGFTVADVGGWDGYFGIRLAEDLDAQATNVDRRSRNLPIRHRVLDVTADTVHKIGAHDAILALSILHHMDDWQAVYEALRAQSRLLIVEAAHPDEAGTAKVDGADRNTGPSYGQVTADGHLLGATPGPNGVDRPLMLVRNAAWGPVADGTGQAASLISDGDFSALGYQPYPGTLNVTVGREARDWIAALPGVTVASGRSRDLYVPVTANGLDAHASLSRDHGSVELLAPVSLRAVLNVANGDTVEIRLRRV